MSSEWHSIENLVELTKDERELIEETVPHLSTITSSGFGNLEEFDQYGGQASFFNSENQPVGITITYALFGDHQLPENFRELGECLIVDARGHPAHIQQVAGASASGSGDEHWLA